jgi:2-polyprenyl-6-methoxyphenol hydroxylase-like FAD-dependent oxidoreductase
LARRSGTTAWAVTGRFPVAIIGGGPAGLATALALAQAEVPVVVFEPQSSPADTVCGEGIMPAGVAALGALGIDVEALGLPFRGVCYLDEQNRPAVGSFAPGRAGVGIRRTLLIAALEEHLRQFPSARIVRTAVEDLEFGPDAVRVSTKETSRSIDVSCVVGCDGRRSATRAILDLDGAPPIAQRRWGARQHFRCRPWRSEVEVTWAEGVEAYVTPVASDCVGVAWLWDPERFRPQPAGARLAEGLMTPFPRLAERIAGADSASVISSCGPMAVAASAAHADRALLLGDALGFFDGIAGEGLSVAIQGALQIGRQLPELWRRQTLDAAALKPLGKQLVGGFQDSASRAKRALVLAAHPALRQRAIRLLARSPLTFSHVLQVGAGQRSAWRLPVFELGRLGRGLFD